MRYPVIAGAGLVLLALACLGQPAAWAADGAADRPHITVAVTDSGLGGLSVVAAAERSLREAGVTADIDLVFCNALFDADSGYNSLPSRDAKVAMFDRALAGLAAECRPDLVVIACNTLSVLYKDTAFAARGAVPVIDIVDCGVDLIASRLPVGSPGAVIILGTETTVGEGTHKSALVARGYAPEHIITQACPQLASCIESGYDSEETTFLVDAYVSDATAGFGGVVPAPLYVSLNCTHFGYALAAWQAAFAARGIAVDAVLDPNRSLADEVRGWLGAHGAKAAREGQSIGKVSVRVVSMPEIAPGAIGSISRWLQAVSPATAAALRGYERRAGLFSTADLWPGVGGR
jgi:glutamate racemase